MEENAKKSLVIARRIQLKFVSELVSSIFLFCAIMVLGIALSFSALIVISALIMAIFAIYVFFHLKNIYANNHSNEILVTYNNETFKILDEHTSLYIEKSNITDLNYKREYLFICTPYFISQTQYNYGKFYIYFNDGTKTKKLTIHNVAEPDKVYDKISDILGWNSIDDE